VDVWSRLTDESQRNVVVRMDDNTLWAFGRNTPRALGTTQEGSSPALIPGLVGKTIVDACNTGFYALAVDDAGGLWAHGESLQGALGQGPSGPTTTTTWLAVPFPETGVVVRRALCGPNAAYALDSTGSVWSWGNDLRGGLGNGPGGNTTSPARVLGIAGSGTLTGVVDFAAASGGGGSMHVIAALGDGRVVTWGEDTNGVLGHASAGCVASINCTEVPGLVCGPGTANRATCDAGANLLSNVTRVSAGQSVHVALSGGALYAWGNDNYGKLGKNTDAAHSAIPVAVGSITGTITEVRSGRDFHLVLTAEGDVWTWGANNYGQLGRGNQSVTCSAGPCVRAPEKIAALDARTITKLAAGAVNAVALDSEAVMWTWGRNENGELGTQTADQVGGGAVGALAPVQVILVPR
jgi:alpha-tubulin suppressor-like RCC1 family protein